MHLNSKTVVGAKSRPIKLVESLNFRLELSNFNEVIKAIEYVTSLKRKIFVNIKQGHFVISALKNIDAASVEKEFLNKGNTPLVSWLGSLIGLLISRSSTAPSTCWG